MQVGYLGNSTPPKSYSPCMDGDAIFSLKNFLKHLRYGCMQTSNFHNGHSHLSSKPSALPTFESVCTRSLQRKTGLTSASSSSFPIRALAKRKAEIEPKNDLGVVCLDKSLTKVMRLDLSSSDFYHGFMNSCKLVENVNTSYLIKLKQGVVHDSDSCDKDNSSQPRLSLVKILTPRASKKSEIILDSKDEDLILLFFLANLLSSP
ncbi:hypothetical protein VNO77_42156 [Canavalia gladiata]|uniref:Uncharacterized protein n=1 Tax=Canavalia gladiata TaxID=3824 RepID=A0AAN9K135_CANGL